MTDLRFGWEVGDMLFRWGTKSWFHCWKGKTQDGIHCEFPIYLAVDFFRHPVAGALP